MGVLDGKAIVITGAGQGLGAAHAMLAAEHGAQIMVNDIDAQAAADTVSRIRAAGGEAEADLSDISTWEGANALIDHCTRAFGGIDGVVNNAAVFYMAGPLDEDPEQLRRMVEINLLGTAYVGMAAARAMVAQNRRGAIVNTTSGAQSGSEQMSTYAASKGGVASMTYSWALDLGPHQIRVNAISPQARTQQAIKVSAELHLGKTPEMVAPLVVYLLSDLSQALNGQVFYLSGDELALLSHPAIVMPAANNPHWTVESIAEIVEKDFGQRLMPVGRSRQEIKVLMHSTSFDVK